MILNPQSRTDSRVFFNEHICELFSVKYAYSESWRQSFCMSDWNDHNIYHVVWGV
jgi:hypothetical protein